MELLENQREIDTLKKKLEEKENHISVLVKKLTWSFVVCGEITRFFIVPCIKVLPPDSKDVTHMWKDLKTRTVLEPSKTSSPLLLNARITVNKEAPQSHVKPAAEY